VDSFYSQPPDTRDHAIASDRATNYGVVRLELLEQIYHDLYMQRIKNPCEDKWQHNVLRCRSVTSVDFDPTASKVRLTIQNHDFVHQPELGQHVSKEHLDVDLAIVATGYIRDAHEDMLKEAKLLRPANSASRDGWRVGRNYKVKLNDALVSDSAGLWLQGCNESTHGLSDSLLSILATRGGEMVGSIFGRHI
jgi:L-ornithine N5-oxygenase